MGRRSTSRFTLARVIGYCERQADSYYRENPNLNQPNLLSNVGKTQIFLHTCIHSIYLLFCLFIYFYVPFFFFFNTFIFYFYIIFQQRRRDCACMEIFNLTLRLRREHNDDVLSPLLLFPLENAFSLFSSSR